MPDGDEHGLEIFVLAERRDLLSAYRTVVAHRQTCARLFRPFLYGFFLLVVQRPELFVRALPPVEVGLQSGVPGVAGLPFLFQRLLVLLCRLQCRLLLFQDEQGILRLLQILPFALQRILLRLQGIPVHGGELRVQAVYFLLLGLVLLVLPVEAVLLLRALPLGGGQLPGQGGHLLLAGSYAPAGREYEVEVGGDGLALFVHATERCLGFQILFGAEQFALLLRPVLFQPNAPVAEAYEPEFHLFGMRTVALLLPLLLPERGEEVACLGGTVPLPDEQFLPAEVVRLQLRLAGFPLFLLLFEVQ